MEANLPTAVLHRRRNDDLESQVHASVPFGHIAEPGRHAGCLQGLVGHHLAALVVAHGIHDDDFPALEIMDRERILLQPRHVELPERCAVVRGKRQ